MGTSLVEFYQKHNVSPVRQNVQDLQEHFERRESLYRQMGILPAFIKGRTVVEIGPGSGYNSLYTASLSPATYVLVEGNPAGVEDIKGLIAEHPTLMENVEIAPVFLGDYNETKTFDFVLCEGVLALAGLPDPINLLKQVADFTAPDGVLVITCIDDISYFPETLRRLFAHLLIDPADELANQVEILAPIFSQHLSLLTGVSRRHDDWVVDNLINPASIGKVLPIPEAISALANEFDIYAASPHYVTDWRWYKSIVGDNRNYNQRTIEQYWQNAHNLLDHSQTLPPRPEADNRQLYQLCQTIRDTIRTFEMSRNYDVLTDIKAALDEIIALAQEFSPPVAEALSEAQALLVAEPDPQALTDSKKFGALFGRGQQYLSFSRR